MKNWCGRLRLSPMRRACMWGPWGGIAISIAVVLSSIGALNGWTLLMGQVPMAAAQDGLFPAIFGKLSPRNVPAIGIIVSASLATALVLVQAAGSEGFAAIYKLIVGLSTMTAVIPYAFCALASSLIVGAHGRRRSPACELDRDHRFRLRDVHALWVWTRAGPLRPRPLAARHSGLCLAEAPREQSKWVNSNVKITCGHLGGGWITAVGQEPKRDPQRGAQRGASCVGGRTR